MSIDLTETMIPGIVDDFCPNTLRITHDHRVDEEALDVVVSSRTSVAAVFDGDRYLGMLTADAIGDEIPVTYVPARNTIFLSFALGWAEVIRAADIFIGVNAVDYSGYPDCRPEFISAFESIDFYSAFLEIEKSINMIERNIQINLILFVLMIKLRDALTLKGR